MSINIKKIIVASIILCIFTAMISIIHSVYAQLEIPSTNRYSSSEKRIPETKNDSSVSCNCVAFRLDDVADYSVTNPLLSIMNVFREKNLDLTIGIIGNDFGSDQKLLSYSRGGVVKDNDTHGKFIADENKSGGRIEVANHSWKHENFTELSVDEMSSSIRKTNQKIYDIFGVRPSVFIAPNNQFSYGIFHALQENKMRYLSASERNDPPPYRFFPNMTIYHLPQTAYTGDCKICGDGVKNASWTSRTHNQTMKKINNSIEKYGFAVVTLHAWEYAKGHDQWNFTNIVDIKQINELRVLLDEIKEKGLQIVTLGNVVNHFRELHFHN